MMRLLPVVFLLALSSVEAPAQDGSELRGLAGAIVGTAAKSAPGYIRDNSFSGGVIVDVAAIDALLGRLGAPPGTEVATKGEIESALRPLSAELRGKPLRVMTRDAAIDCSDAPNCVVSGDAVFVGIESVERTSGGVLANIRIEFTDRRPSGASGIGFLEQTLELRRDREAWSVVDVRYRGRS